MVKIRVPVDDRPFIGRYVAGTFLGVAILTSFVWLVSRSFDSMVLGVGVALFAMVAQITIVFVMVESLVAEWFDRAEIAEE